MKLKDLETKLLIWLSGLNKFQINKAERYSKFYKGEK